MLLPRALLFRSSTTSTFATPPTRLRRDLSLDLSLESEARTTLILVGIALAAVFLCSALFFCRHVFLALFRRVFRFGPIGNMATAKSQAENCVEQAAPKKARSPPPQEKPPTTATAYPNGTTPSNNTATAYPTNTALSNNSVMPSTAYFPSPAPTSSPAPTPSRAYPPARPGRTFFTQGPAPIRSASIPRRPAAVYAGTVNGLHHTHPAPLALRPGYPRQYQAPPVRPPRPYAHQSPFGRHHHAHNPYAHPQAYNVQPQGYANYDFGPQGHQDPQIDPKIAALMHAADTVVGAHPNARPLSARIATREEIELISGHVHIPWAFTGSAGGGGASGGASGGRGGTGVGREVGKEAGKAKRPSQPPMAVKVQPPPAVVDLTPHPPTGQQPAHGLQVPGFHQHIPAAEARADGEPTTTTANANARAGPGLASSVLKDLRNTRRRDASSASSGSASGAFEFGEGRGISGVGLGAGMGAGRNAKQHRVRGKENVPPIFGVGKSGRRNRI
ncbi:unnamed protein product [Cyclocybe aegerita]|uniref:Uncharacterized protein n=1 Tax=Cyclocybe aegerita TaxID=1973307 RepID=A0A8S0X5L0_CYCAE|nr:unnamed protein product [Cyclocybe aegerita]